MVLFSSGFAFAGLDELPFLLSDAEAIEQGSYDSPGSLTGTPYVWEVSLVSTAQEMLLYLSRYKLADIADLLLLKRINAYFSNWALEIHGIRDAQERRYEWAVKTLELIRDGAPLTDSTGQRIIALADSSPVPGNGYDSQSFAANRVTTVPNFQQPLRGRPVQIWPPDYPLIS